MVGVLALMKTDDHKQEEGEEEPEAGEDERQGLTGWYMSDSNSRCPTW